MRLSCGVARRQGCGLRQPAKWRSAAPAHEGRLAGGGGAHQSSPPVQLQSQRRQGQQYRRKAPGRGLHDTTSVPHQCNRHYRPGSVSCELGPPNDCATTTLLLRLSAGSLRVRERRARKSNVRGNFEGSCSCATPGWPAVAARQLTGRLVE